METNRLNNWRWLYKIMDKDFNIYVAGHTGLVGSDNLKIIIFRDLPIYSLASIRNWIL